MKGNVRAIEFNKNTTTMSVIKHNRHCHSSTDIGSTVTAMSSQFYDTAATFFKNYFYVMYQYKCSIHYALSYGTLY